MLPGTSCRGDLHRTRLQVISTPLWFVGGPVFSVGDKNIHDVDQRDAALPCWTSRSPASLLARASRLRPIGAPRARGARRTLLAASRLCRSGLDTCAIRRGMSSWLDDSVSALTPPVGDAAVCYVARTPSVRCDGSSWRYPHRVRWEIMLGRRPGLRDMHGWWPYVGRVEPCVRTGQLMLELDMTTENPGIIL